MPGAKFQKSHGFVGQDILRIFAQHTVEEQAGIREPLVVGEEVGPHSIGLRFG